MTSFIQIKKGLKIQIDVIRGLYYRELLTRISKVRFGLIGILFEPIGLIVVWLLLLGFRRGFEPVFTLDLIIFLTSGNVIYGIFNSISRRSVDSINSNYALFYYILDRLLYKLYDLLKAYHMYFINNILLYQL